MAKQGNPPIKQLLIVGKNASAVRELQQDLAKHGFTVRSKHPQAVVSLGGDGTYLIAERKYPGIPKILIRDSKVCHQCSDDDAHDIFYQLRRGEYRIEEHFKLEAAIIRKQDRNANSKNKHQDKAAALVAANDITIRNKLPTEALRFTVACTTAPADGELIGDGLVVATPYGSTGYFHSITRQQFKKGIGVAFNNTAAPRRHLLLSDSAVITVTIVRNSAHVAADNNRSLKTVREGDRIIIRKSKSIARLIRTGSKRPAGGRRPLL